MKLAACSLLALSMMLNAQGPSARSGPSTAHTIGNWGESKYGIALHSPKDYQLTSGRLSENDRGLGYLGSIPMEFVAPGGERVVTIEAPPSAFAGTTFTNSFFTVGVNPFLTEDECGRFPHDIPGSKTPVERRLSGIQFLGLKQGGVAMSHYWDGIYYHGYSAGLCYEIGYGMASVAYGVVDGLKPVNADQVFSILEQILESFAVHPPEKGEHPTNLPSIRTFEVTPFSLNSPSNYYRLFWTVEGAEPDQVWLAVSCSGDLTIVEVTESGEEGAEFPCDTLRPAITLKGSLGLEFRNMAGNPVQGSLRVYAAGAKSASVTRMFLLDSLPVVISIESDGRHCFPCPDPSKGDFELIAGHKIHIEGVAFLPKETLWIGSKSLLVESPDGKNIDFTVPESLTEGAYWLFLANERGKSNRTMVRVTK